MTSGEHVEELGTGSKLYLKKATREMDRSSTGVREDEKMDRSTVGVTGIREFDVGCWNCGVLLDVGTNVDELDVDELGMPVVG